MGNRKCPFCGEKEQLLFVRGFGFVAIRCERCGARGPEAHDDEYARELWQDRDDD